MIAHANQIGVPVFAIGLLLDKDDSLRMLARKTGGAYFSVRDASAIDSVFNTIAEQLFEKGCCNVWYTSPRPAKDGTWRTVDADVIVDNDTTAISDEGYRAPVSTSSVEERQRAQGSLTVVPNMATNSATLLIRTDTRMRADVRIINVLGKTVLIIPDVEIYPGEKRVDLSLEGITSGRYILHVSSPTFSEYHVLEIAR